VNLRGTGNTFPKVIVDGMPRGELDALRSISVFEIQELRFLNSGDATTRFGTGYAAGAIEVITKSVTDGSGSGAGWSTRKELPIKSGIG